MRKVSDFTQTFFDYLFDFLKMGNVFIVQDITYTDSIYRTIVRTIISLLRWLTLVLLIFRENAGNSIHYNFFREIGKTNFILSFLNRFSINFFSWFGKIELHRIFNCSGIYCQQKFGAISKRLKPKNHINCWSFS